MLSNGEVFRYGVLGALMALAAVHVLPFAFELAKGATLTITVGRVIGVVLIVAVFVGVGGGIAVVLAQSTDGSKQAIVYGLGWQSTIGGFIQGTRAGLA